MSAQTSFPYQDLAADLAARIASAIPSGAQVSLAAVPENQTDDMTAFAADQASRLMSRGIRVGEAAEGVTAIRLGCRQNLRERSCVAEIESGTARNIVMVTRPHDGRPRPEAAWFSLDVRPLVAQRVQLLDARPTSHRIALARGAIHAPDGQSFTVLHSAPHDQSASRIVAELQAQGQDVGRKRVARLMKAAGLRGRRPPRWTWNRSGAGTATGSSTTGASCTRTGRPPAPARS